jgi:hypothetical protein
MNMKVLNWLWVLLLLTVPARAATYNVTGFDSNGTVVLIGTIDVDNGPLSAVDLTIAYTPAPFAHFAGTPICVVADCASSPQGLPDYAYIFTTGFTAHELFDFATQTYRIHFDMSGQEGLGIGFSLLDGLLQGAFIADGCGPVTGCLPGVKITSGTVTNTPLPAALPLFATGLAGLGLLGWRRKKKAQAAAA